MKALIDRHHHALYYSLQLLFEDRLGIPVYTPVGREWWDEGYWRFGEGYGDDRLAQQYLSLDGWTLNAEFPWSYESYDGHHPDRLLRGVTLEVARKVPQDWGYVVATVQDNQRGFKRFADEVGARYVLHAGNTNQFIDWSLDPLVIATNEMPIRGKGVRVHQEIDQRTFRYVPPTDAKVIRSFVNCFDSTPCFRPFSEMSDILTEFEFHNHGIDGNNIETVAEIADLMAGSAFGWHDKIQGDGFGHVVHDWAAIGRPLIGHGSHYRGLMAEPFWQDLVTCIDLDRHTLAEAAGLVREIMADPVKHSGMCNAIRAEFDRIDWDGEAAQIRELLMPQAVAA